MSRKGAAQLKTGSPIMPQIPHTGNPRDMEKWATEVTLEIERYFGKIRNELTDFRSYIFVDRQVVVDGFTIQPTAAYVDLLPVFNTETEEWPEEVVSSAEVAIALGVPRQVLTVTNWSGSFMVIKNSAQTHMRLLEDIRLEGLQAATFRWDEGLHLWVQWVTLTV